MEEEYIKYLEKEKEERPNRLTAFLEGKFFVPIVIILVAILAFALGRLSKIEDSRVPVRVLDTGAVNNSSPNPSPRTRTGSKRGMLNLREGSSATAESGAKSSSNSESVMVVGSKNSTKYHYPWCPGAKQIADKNLVTWSSIEEARASGYTPAGTCKGLE